MEKFIKNPFFVVPMNKINEKECACNGKIQIKLVVFVFFFYHNYDDNRVIHTRILFHSSYSNYLKEKYLPNYELILTIIQHHQQLKHWKRQKKSKKEKLSNQIIRSTFQLDLFSTCLNTVKNVENSINRKYGVHGN